MRVAFRPSVCSCSTEVCSGFLNIHPARRQINRPVKDEHLLQKNTFCAAFEPRGKSGKYEFWLETVSFGFPVVNTTLIVFLLPRVEKADFIMLFLLNLLSSHLTGDLVLTHLLQARPNLRRSLRLERDVKKVNMWSGSVRAEQLMFYFEKLSLRS